MGWSYYFLIFTVFLYIENSHGSQVINYGSFDKTDAEFIRPDLLDEATEAPSFDSNVVLTGDVEYSGLFDLDWTITDADSEIQFYISTAELTDNGNSISISSELAFGRIL